MSKKGAVQRMLWFNRAEKAGRGVFWLALSSAFVIAPISYVHAHTEEAERQAASQEAARAAEHADVLARQAAALAEKADLRVFISTMGEYMTALDLSEASGKLWFTNATPRKGVLCVTGVAENRAAQTSATSLVECQSVAAYASGVHLSLMFAGSSLRATCPTPSACILTIKDAP